MRKKRKITLSLTGGLGNQLFQLAAGLKISIGSQLTISTIYGKPRQNNQGRAEILSFVLPSRVRTDSGRSAPWLIRKIAGYFLRVGVAPRGFEKSKFFLFPIKIILVIMFNIYLKKFTSIIYAKNLGYADVKVKNRNSLIFGYFQSYYWAIDPLVKKEMMLIHVPEHTDTILEYSSLAEIEKPLIVHVRLGDYLNEKNFGIPSASYYAKGIEHVLSFNKCSTIWLFSDDIELAKGFIPEENNLPIRCFGQILDSTAATFEVMRLGCGYVIANSTFSWWAAFLSKASGVEVVAPQPWFAGLSEPIYLIPKNWTRIKSG
jgi:hypothetical protein